MKKVIGYIRVSTDNQDFERQRMLIRRHCESKGYSLLKIEEDYAISGTISGKNGKTDPLKTEESDPLKLSLPKSKKLSSVLGSKRSRFSPIKLYYLSLFPVRTGHFAKIDISPNIFMSGPI